MNVFLLPYPPQHIRFHCVLLHNHELSIYILCCFVILGEEHGYSSHTDILRHGNSSRIINETPMQSSSTTQHAKRHTQQHTTPHDCTHHNTHHTHCTPHAQHTQHSTRLEYTASVLTKRIIYDSRFFFLVYSSPVFYSSSGSDALLCTCIGKHKQFKTRKKDKKKERKKRTQRRQPKKPKQIEGIREMSDIMHV